MSDNPNMVRAITYAIVAALMLAMPSFLQSMIDMMGGNIATSGADSMGSMAEGLQQGMGQLMNIISGGSYIMGIGFGVKAALELKATSEEQYYENEDDKQVSSEKVAAVPEEKKIEIQPVNQVAKRKLPAGYPENLDTEDEELNNRIAMVLNKITAIQKIPALSNLIEEKMLLENTRDEYLNKIVHSYVAIPMDLREKSLNGKPSAREMIFSQLDMIDDKLITVEEDALHAQQKEIRMNNAVLKEHFEINENAFIIDESIFEKPVAITAQYSKGNEIEAELEINR
jgi:uncharacterized protein YaaR (DUF327 family)